VALAALADAVRAGCVDRDELVLLNITGGGRARQAREIPLVPAEPWLRVPWPRDGDGPRRVAEQVSLRLPHAPVGSGAAR
jgi:cysteate synthase